MIHMIKPLLAGILGGLAPQLLMYGEAAPDDPDGVLFLLFGGLIGGVGILALLLVLFVAGNMSKSRASPHFSYRAADGDGVTGRRG